MLLSELKEVLALKHIAGPEAEAFASVYAGDLLSRADLLKPRLRILRTRETRR